MQGIKYVVDDNGVKSGVLIDLKKHANLWEDFHDLLVARLRENEPDTSIGEVEENLKKLGKLGE